MFQKLRIQQIAATTLLTTALMTSVIGANPNRARAPSPVAVLAGELVSVALTGSDIGSRISHEGDTFAVLTTEDLRVRGALLLPKGSPGYGTITHLKRAGHFHAGGELAFTVDRLIAPDGAAIVVATNGATADADKAAEKNGNLLTQILIYKVGVLARRGDDMLIKEGTTFHVSIARAVSLPVVGASVQPAKIDWTLVTRQPEAAASP